MQLYSLYAQKAGLDIGHQETLWFMRWPWPNFHQHFSHCEASLPPTRCKQENQVKVSPDWEFWHFVAGMVFSPPTISWDTPTDTSFVLDSPLLPSSSPQNWPPEHCGLVCLSSHMARHLGIQGEGRQLFRGQKRKGEKPAGTGVSF